MTILWFAILSNLCDFFCGDVKTSVDDFLIFVAISDDRLLVTNLYNSHQYYAAANWIIITSLTMAWHSMWLIHSWFLNSWEINSRLFHYKLLTLRLIICLLTLPSYYSYTRVSFLPSFSHFVNFVSVSVNFYFFVDGYSMDI